MLKIHPYYQTQADLQKAEEPYKSVAAILDRLYLKGPGDKKELSEQNFKDSKAVSCIRDIAEDLEKSQVTFVSRMKTLWRSLLHPQKVFSDTFDNYAVPYERYQGTIFGGVYFVLAKQKTVDDAHLDMLDTFVSGYSEAQPYFNVFKSALAGDARPLAPQPPIVTVPKTTDTKTLRRQFIEGLNARRVQTDAINWADATMGFDRGVMTELFWGINDDAYLKTIIKAIVSTWNRLAKANDNRCMVSGTGGAATLAMAASIDRWKFGGMMRETINKFFDDLWVERKARNTYATFSQAGKAVKPKDEPSSKREADSGSKTEGDKPTTGHTDDEVEQLREKLTEVMAERDYFEDELKAYMERNQNRRGINRLKTAHLGMKLATKLGINVTNKKELAPMLSKLFGWGQNSLEKQMSKYISTEEELELADIFGELSPDLAKEICASWKAPTPQESEAPTPQESEAPPAE